MTKEERKEAFLKDLQKILNKHTATLSLESETIGWHSEYFITVDMPVEWDEESFEETKSWIKIRLDDYLTPEK